MLSPDVLKFPSLSSLWLMLSPAVRRFPSLSSRWLMLCHAVTALPLVPTRPCCAGLVPAPHCAAFKCCSYSVLAIAPSLLPPPCCPPSSFPCPPCCPSSLPPPFSLPPPCPAASPVAALNAEHAVAANLVQGVCNHLTHTVVVTGRDGCNVLQQQQHTDR